jgi:hypothetical protein
MAIQLSEDQKEVLFGLLAKTLSTGFVAGHEGEPLIEEWRSRLEAARVSMILGEWGHLDAGQLRLLDFVVGYGIQYGESLHVINVAKSLRPLLTAEAERLEPTPRRVP